jgi:hypothetical protein
MRHLQEHVQEWYGATTMFGVAAIIIITIGYHILW